MTSGLTQDLTEAIKPTRDSVSVSAPVIARQNGGSLPVTMKRTEDTFQPGSWNHRLGNLIPSKLKGKTNAKDGDFGIMHFDTGPRTLACSPDEAAKRTSESIAEAARRAEQEGYVPLSKRKVPHLPGSLASTSTRRHPLTASQTKAEQARLLILLRNLQPTSVVDQICKALVFFGGPMGAPLPAGGEDFPVSAEANGPGSLFVSWLAEIFPRLGPMPPSSVSQFSRPIVLRRPRGRPRGSRNQSSRENTRLRRAKALSTPTSRPAGSEDGEEWVDMNDARLDVQGNGDHTLDIAGTPLGEVTRLSGNTGREALREQSATKHLVASYVPPATGKRRGRPKGSKNRPRKAVETMRNPTEGQTPQTPQITDTSKAKDAERPAVKDRKAGRGRPKGSKNKPKDSGSGLNIQKGEGWEQPATQSCVTAEATAGHHGTATYQTVRPNLGERQLGSAEGCTADVHKESLRAPAGSAVTGSVAGRKRGHGTRKTTQTTVDDSAASENVTLEAAGSMEPATIDEPPGGEAGEIAQSSNHIWHVAKRQKVSIGSSRAGPTASQAYTSSGITNFQGQMNGFGGSQSGDSATSRSWLVKEDLQVSRSGSSQFTEVISGQVQGPPARKGRPTAPPGGHTDSLVQSNVDEIDQARVDKHLDQPLISLGRAPSSLPQALGMDQPLMGQPRAITQTQRQAPQRRSLLDSPDSGFRGQSQGPSKLTTCVESPIVRESSTRQPMTTARRSPSSRFQVSTSQVAETFAILGTQASAMQHQSLGFQTEMAQPGSQYGHSRPLPSQNADAMSYDSLTPANDLGTRSLHVQGHNAGVDLFAPSMPSNGRTIEQLNGMRIFSGAIGSARPHQNRRFEGHPY